MMTFGHSLVPASWIHILDVTQLDGSPIPPDEKMGQRCIGMSTLCWLAGEPLCPCLYFAGDFRINGDSVQCDHMYVGFTTPGYYPQHIRPDVFAFTSETMIYTFRLLSDEEINVIQSFCEDQLQPGSLSVPQDLSKMKSFDKFFNLQ